MKTTFECLPCLLRQAVDATAHAGVSPENRALLLREVLAELSRCNLEDSPPAMSAWINRRLREYTGIADPYRAEKQAHNKLAAALSAQWREEITISSDPFYRATRLAIAGNIIDLGAKSGLNDEDISATIRQALSAPFVNLKLDLESAVHRAQRILYLTDNAGEIFFDRLLLERFPAGKTTVAVRGSPVLNDATLEDAHAAGLHELATLTDNGSDAPGTLLPECSAEFRTLFAEADVIIAKGQGNFESLNHCRENIFFLFMAKCPVVAQQLRVQPGTHITTGPTPAFGRALSC